MHDAVAMSVFGPEVRKGLVVNHVRPGRFKTQSEARPIDITKQFFERVRVDKFIGQLDDKNEWGTLGYYWDSNDEKWHDRLHRKNSQPEQTYEEFAFEPRFIKYMSPTGIEYKYAFSKLLGRGTYGAVYEFVLHARLVDPNRQWERLANTAQHFNDGEIPRFAVKIPKRRFRDDGTVDSADTTDHEKYVIKRLTNAGLMGEGCLITVVKESDLGCVYLMETCEGSLDTLQASMPFAKAMQIMHAFVRQCVLIHNKTAPDHLIPEDMKPANTLWTVKSNTPNSVTVLVADLGQFVPKHTRHAIATFNLEKANAHGYVADESHLAYTIGVMLLMLVRPASSRWRDAAINKLRDFLTKTEVEDKAHVFPTVLRLYGLEPHRKVVEDLMGIILDDSGAPMIMDTDDPRRRVKTMMDILAIFDAFFETLPPDEQPLPYAVFDDDHQAADDSAPSELSMIHGFFPRNFKPWNNKYGCSTFTVALNILQFHGGYRGRCCCECNCMRMKKSGEEWEVIAPSDEGGTGKLYPHWASTNNDNGGLFFIACTACACNFTRGSPRMCRGTGAVAPRYADGEWKRMWDWTATDTVRWASTVGISGNPVPGTVNESELLPVEGVDDNGVAWPGWAHMDGNAVMKYDYTKLDRLSVTCKRRITRYVCLFSKPPELPAGTAVGESAEAPPEPLEDGEIQHEIPVVYQNNDDDDRMYEDEVGDGDDDAEAMRIDTEGIDLGIDADTDTRGGG